MKYFYTILCILFIFVSNAQQIISIPLQTTVDTTTILNVVQLLQDTTSKAHSVVAPLLQTPPDSIVQTDTTAQKLAITDSIPQPTDTMQALILPQVEEEYVNPENISITKVITGEYWVSNTKHTDIMIDSSILSKLVIEHVTCTYLTISAVSVTQIIIKNSVISDLLIEDSSIGELIIENSKITEFTTEQSAIKKQLIVSKSAKPVQPTASPVLVKEDDDE